MLEVQHLQGTRSKISWLLRIRALVIACLFLGLFLAPALGFMPRNFIGLYIAILSFLVVWSVYTWRWILFGSTPVTDRDMLMQLIVDLVVGVLVLAMTGGIYNPLCILFLVLVLVAAMILEKNIWLFSCFCFSRVLLICSGART